MLPLVSRAFYDYIIKWKTRPQKVDALVQLACYIG